MPSLIWPAVKLAHALLILEGGMSGSVVPLFPYCQPQSAQGVSTMLHEVPTLPKAQDVHISCNTSLVESLVAEFQQQLAETPGAEVYDYGWSSRFSQGYIVVAFKGYAPATFLSQLTSDERLEGHSIYDLPVESPLYIAEQKGGQLTW